MEGGNTVLQSYTVLQTHLPWWQQQRADVTLTTPKGAFIWFRYNGWHDVRTNGRTWVEGEREGGGGGYKVYWFYN